MKQIKPILLVLMLLIFLTAFIPETAVSAAKAPSVGAKTMNMRKGKTKDAEIKDIPKGSTCQWSSSNKKVATVDGNGAITAVSQGSAKITCTIKTKTKTYKYTFSVNVYNGAKTAAVTDKISAAAVGDTFSLHSEISPKNSDITVWESTDEKVAKIDSTGKVTALAPGEVTLRFNTLSGMSDYITIKVFDKNTKLLTSSDLLNGKAELKGGEFKDIFISKYIDQGQVVLDGVKVTGTLIVESGMPYTVDILNSQIEKLEFVKPLDIHNVVDGKTDPAVRIKDNTTINLALIKSYSILQQTETGKINSITFSPELDGYLSSTITGYTGDILVDYTNDCIGRMALNGCKIGTVDIINGGYICVLTDGDNKSAIDTVNLHTPSSTAALDTEIGQVNVDELIGKASFIIANRVKKIINHGNELTFSFTEDGIVEELTDEKNKAGGYGTYSFFDDSSLGNFKFTIKLKNDQVEGITYDMLNQLINKNWSDKSVPVKDPSGKITVEYKENSYYMYDFCGTNIKLDIYFEKTAMKLYGGPDYQLINLSVIK